MRARSSTYSTGFDALDPSSDRNAPYMQLYQGCFMIVSGLPGGGKTAWTTQLAFNMARLHGWRAAVASFEMRVTPTLRDMLRGFYIAEARDLFRNPSAIPDDFRASWSTAEVRDADAFIEEFFSFIALDPRDDDTEADCEWLIDRAGDAVIRDGANMLIVDPWNEVEHRRRGNESVADYTNRAIRSLQALRILLRRVHGHRGASHQGRRPLGEGRRQGVPLRHLGRCDLGEQG